MPTQRSTERSTRRLPKVQAPDVNRTEEGKEILISGGVLRHGKEEESGGSVILNASSFKSRGTHRPATGKDKEDERTR